MIIRQHLLKRRRKRPFLHIKRSGEACRKREYPISVVRRRFSDPHHGTPSPSPSRQCSYGAAAVRKSLPRRYAAARFRSFACGAVSGSAIPGRRTNSHCPTPAPGVRRSFVYIRFMLEATPDCSRASAVFPSARLIFLCSSSTSFGRGLSARSPRTFISRWYSASAMSPLNPVAYRSPTSKLCPPSASPRQSASKTEPLNDCLVGCAKMTYACMRVQEARPCRAESGLANR